MCVTWVKQLHTPVGKLPGLQVDLVDELPGWSHHDGFGLLELAEAAGGHAVRHQLLENRQQERSLVEGGHV